MAYSIKTYSQLYNLIVQEIRNGTGLTISSDSDAGIRATGTASVVEGLYHHQAYIQRQLFVATADEPFLYIHAEELGLPRNGGTTASGSVTAISNVSLTIAAGSKLTDGKGHYWSVLSAVTLTANVPASISVVADQVGSAWNYSGTTLMWISPTAGLQGTVSVISIAGGSETEELEAWRARLLERKQLGYFRDRSSDIKSVVKSLSYVKDVYVYKKRRGIGSVDVAFTVKSNPPMLPVQSQIDEAQALLDSASDFYFDSKAYAPDKDFINISATISGTVALADVETTITAYMNELAPQDEYQYIQLLSRILKLSGVTDVVLAPNSNITPILNPFHTGWLRLGYLNVQRSS